MNHFFTGPENILKDRVIIEGSDVNHIKNVLRMKPGDQLIVNDGEGAQLLCEIAETGDSTVVCTILSREAAGSEPCVRFYLFQGLPKSDKLEHVIQKSVELGVYEIIPTKTARSIVKYDEKKQKSRIERWQKIAEGAAKQSGRGIIPKVCGIMTFKEALSCAGQLDMVLIPYENFKDMSSTRETISRIKPGSSVGIFVGPEGGFETSEVDQAVEAGAQPISLGPRILRTETAPLMLLSVLTFGLEE